MKNLFLTLFAVILVAETFAQSIIDKHYSHYLEDENATVVHVSGNLFGYASQLMAEDDIEGDATKIKNLLSNIESFSLISVPELSDPKAEMRKGLSTLRQTHEDLVIVRDKQNSFTLMIKESDNVIEELVGIGSADSSFFVFSLVGRITMDDISDITDMIQEKQALPLQSQSKMAIKDYKVYPNPVSSNSTLNVDIPDNLVGGQITLVDASGKDIKTLAATSNRQEISLSDVPSGNVFVQIQKGELQVKKQVIVIK